MELILLDSNFSPVSAPIDRYYSLTWKQRYYPSGEFDLYLSADYLPNVRAASYIYNNAAGEVMVIEDVKATDDGERKLNVSGSSLDTMFRWRVMDTPAVRSGEAETVVRDAVATYAMTGARAFPTLEFGATAGITDTVNAKNKRGITLYDWLCDTLKPLGASWKVQYNYIENKLYFIVFRGLDRTQEQTENTWAVFSMSYENLRKFTYVKNTADYRNYAIITTNDDSVDLDGYDDNNDPIYVLNHNRSNAVVNKTNGNQRREIFVTADNNEGLTSGQLIELGKSTLAEYAPTEHITGEVQQSGMNLIYGEDYSLGDICDLTDNALGISGSARLTEVTTVYEDGAEIVTPAFGEGYLSLREFIKREAKK